MEGQQGAPRAGVTVRGDYWEGRSSRRQKIFPVPSQLGLPAIEWGVVETIATSASGAGTKKDACDRPGMRTDRTGASAYSRNSELQVAGARAANSSAVLNNGVISASWPSRRAIWTLSIYSRGEGRLGEETSQLAVRGRMSRIFRLAYAASGVDWKDLPDTKGEGKGLSLSDFSRASRRMDSSYRRASSANRRRL
eukprot:scaffold9522_cov147-Isochrysis_galbana.AAC.2